jgi:enoyl-CoA hydratase/carnithine racemase
MRALPALVALATLAMRLPAHAQDAGQTQSVRADLQAERTKLVAANLQLTEPEAAKFWPLYNEYRVKHSQLDDRAIALVDDFAANYESLSDEKAKDLLKRQLELEDDRLKLRRSYVGKFEKVVPPKKVARYYQIERKLDAAVAYEAAKSIPLAR